MNKLLTIMPGNITSLYHWGWEYVYRDKILGLQAELEDCLHTLMDSVWWKKTLTLATNGILNS